jgi:hypothetical protein
VLDRTHRRGGLHQQPRPRAVLRVQRDPHRHVQRHVLAVDAETASQRLAQPGGRSVGLVAPAGQRQDEFVTGVARDADGVGHGRTQPRGHLGQQAVAAGVAVGLVDHAEVVQPEVDHGQRRAVAVAAVHGVVQQRFEMPARGQSRHAVGLDRLRHRRAPVCLAVSPRQRQGGQQHHRATHPPHARCRTPHKVHAPLSARGQGA